MCQSDGVTAAERFFSSKHENLFEFQVENVRIPNRPYKKRKSPSIGRNKEHSLIFGEIFIFLDTIYWM